MDKIITREKPVDAGWNVAVKHMARITLPGGWDEFETFAESPYTLKSLTEYANAHGRLAVAKEDSDGTIFACADTNVHLRAWHDGVHYRHQLAFNVAGEAAAVYVQAAQVYEIYGVNDRSVAWVQLLLSDILGLVIFNKQSGRYPNNKRAGTVNAAPQWRHLAERIGRECRGKDHEQKALALAKKMWGDYRG